MLIFKRLFFSLNLLITSSGQGVWLCNACLVMFRISNANKCLVMQVHSFEWYQLCFVSMFLVCVMWKTLGLFTVHVVTGRVNKMVINVNMFGKASEKSIGTAFLDVAQRIS